MLRAVVAGLRSCRLRLSLDLSQLFVDDVMDRDDVTTVVSGCITELPAGCPVDDVVSFYLKSRELARSTLVDGAGIRPHYSLRTLCRALTYARELYAMKFPVNLSLFEVRVGCRLCCSVSITIMPPPLCSACPCDRRVCAPAS